MISTLTIIAAVQVLIISIFVINNINKEHTYQLAKEQISNNEFSNAQETLSKIEEYKDVDELYWYAEKMNKGDYASVIKKENLTEFVIPDGVTSIGWRAFYGCSGLTSITIPDSVTSIGYNAFRDCGKLTRITYAETKNHWEKIKKLNGWDLNTGNYTIYCMDGII